MYVEGCDYFHSGQTWTEAARTNRQRRNDEGAEHELQKGTFQNR